MSNKFKKLLSFFTLLVFLVTNSSSSYALSLFLTTSQEDMLINSFIHKYNELAIKDNLKFKCISSKASNQSNNTFDNASTINSLKDLPFDLQVIQSKELGTSNEQSLSNYSLINNVDGKFFIPELTENNVYSNQYFLLTLKESLKDSISSLKIVKDKENITYYYQDLTKDDPYLLKDLLLSPGSYTFNISYLNSNNVINNEIFTFEVDTLDNSNYESDEITNVETTINTEDNTLTLNWSEKTLSDKVDFNLYKPIKVLFKNLELTSVFSVKTTENTLNFNASYELKDKLQIGETYQGEIFTVDSLGNIVNKEFSFNYENNSIPDAPKDEVSPNISFIEILESGSHLALNSSILKKNSFLGIKISDENIASSNNFLINNINQLSLLKKDANGIYLNYSNYKLNFDSSFEENNLTNSILKLTDSSGNLLSDGDYKITFSAKDDFANISDEASLEFTVFNDEITDEDIKYTLKYENGSALYYNQDIYYFNNTFILNLDSLNLPTNYSKAAVKVYKVTANDKELVKTYDKKYSSASYKFIIELADLNAVNMDLYEFEVEVETVRGDTISLPNFTAVYDYKCDDYNFTVNSATTKLSENEYLSKEEKIDFNVDFLEKMDTSTTKVLFSNNGVNYSELPSANNENNYILDISQSSMAAPIFVKIVGNDLAQNPLTEKIYKFYYDGSAPEISAVYSDNLPMYNDKVVFSTTADHPIKVKFKVNTEVNVMENVFAISISDPNYSSYSYELSKDGQAYNGSLNNLSAGHYILKVTALDSLNNSNTNTLIYIENIADGETYKPGLSPKISITKNAEYTMLLNGKEYDGSKINKEGDYTLEIKAKDSVGNENSLSISFTIAKDADKTVTTSGNTNSTSSTNNNKESDNSSLYKNAFTHNKLIFTITLTTVVLVVCGGSFIVYSYKKGKKNIVLKKTLLKNKLLKLIAGILKSYLLFHFA